MAVNIPCLEAMAMNLIDSIPLFGTYCICLTNIHIRRLIENKQLICVAKSMDYKQKTFQTDDIEICV